MTGVMVRKDGIEISGHAGYAETGKDIVCAGVTALTQTLIRSLEHLTRDEIEYKISSGRADIQESVGRRKASGGFLFHWHLPDCR